MRPRLLRFIFLLVGALCAGSFLFTKAGTSDSLQPVALSTASSGGLYALDRTEGLFYIPGGGADLYLKDAIKVAAFRPSWQAIDMVAVSIGSDERVYVLLGQETIGMLLCYTNRKFERSWISKTLLTGITADTEGHRLFLSGALKNEIYVFDWNDPGSSLTKLLVSVPESQILGPLALDSSGHTLYAGDQRTGTIFGIDLASKSVSKAAQFVGQPNAFAFDSSKRALIIADSVGQKVWRLDVTTRKMQVISNSPELREPTAIAIDGNGGIWVGDFHSRAIFRLSSAGPPTAYHLIVNRGSTSQE